ncbi:ribonuclease P protein subunit p20 [Drosophila tropicalis]|uniref:ribonuclease P protein subunit p20 n=1 Tax=Drosophila tropicalis TaxID=46794 RepID=UPI0035ABE3FF
MDNKNKPNNRHNRGRGQQNSNSNQRYRVVRKVPPRAANDNESRNNIYITSKTDIKAQQKRCEDILNSGAKEIYIHCMGYSIIRGLNLALQIVEKSEGALSYVIHTSTIRLVDELHPLCDDEDISFRQRNNSALHIKIYNSSLFDIVVPKLPAQPSLPAGIDDKEVPPSQPRKKTKKQKPHYHHHQQQQPQK